MPGRLRRALRAARRELRTPLPVTWQLVDAATDGDSFRGQTVLITGASGMIGTSLVSAFLGQGATVHAVDRVAPERHRTAPSTADTSDQLHIHVADLTDRADIAHLAAAVPTLDVLINNAGFNDLHRDIHDLDADGWRRSFDTNVIAHGLLVGHLATKLRTAPGASIVNITSIQAAAPSHWPAYAAAKAALAKLSVDLALQFAGHGVRVNSVAPGWVLPHDADLDRRAEAVQPLGHGTVPVEAIVHAVLFLADRRRSPCTTGQELLVDGGNALQRSGLATE